MKVIQISVEKKTTLNCFPFKINIPYKYKCCIYLNNVVLQILLIICVLILDKITR